MSDKPFLRIVNDFFIEYDGHCYDLHKPSDIRCLIYNLNRENGFSELECENNSDIVKEVDGKLFFKLRI